MPVCLLKVKNVVVDVMVTCDAFYVRLFVNFGM